MKVKPLSDRIIIKPSPAEEKTKGGIFLPDTAKEKPVVGEVVAVGPGRKSDDGKIVPIEVKAAIKYCTVNIPGRKSPSMVRNT